MKRPYRTLFFITILTILSIAITLTQTVPQSPKFNINLGVGSFEIVRDLSFKLGLDLVGGTSITLSADMTSIPESDRDQALDSAKNVIERRVNLFGVSEPIVQTAKVSGEYRVITELAGVTDVNQAVSLIGKTAELQFMERNVATDSAQLFIPTRVGGRDLKRAFVSFDPNTGQPEVSFELTDEGGKKFGELTRRILTKNENEHQLAIILDNELVSAPVVQSAIDSQGRITGSFTTDEAKELSVQLNAGALPVPMNVIEQRNIGATLGEESIQKSLIAGAVGLFIIALFMIAHYGVHGIIATIALLVYSFTLLALFKLLPVTLTLAGMAGFILSVGMAVDANILIFERMKEELRLRKPKQVAMELGFIRAWSSIRDSNISSLITCLILYELGTGIVRGFALTLAIGILISMFSAIVVTRTFLRALIRR